jgi:hypothetical protein
MIALKNPTHLRWMSFCNANAALLSMLQFLLDFFCGDEAKADITANGIGKVMNTFNFIACCCLFGDVLPVLDLYVTFTAIDVEITCYLIYRLNIFLAQVLFEFFPLCAGFVAVPSFSSNLQISTSVVRSRQPLTVLTS